MAREYRVPASANVTMETLMYIDARVSAGDGTSRGEVIEKAISLYREKAQKDAEKGGRK